MDWLDHLTIFAAVAERGNFVAASRHLGHSPTAVSRAVAALEDALGTQLFTRTTRANALTKAGEAYLEQARRVLAEYAAFRDVDGPQSRQAGLVTITAPEMFGRMHVLPLVQHFMEAYPLIEVSLILLNREVSFIDEGIDLGFRISQLADSSLRAIRLGQVRHVLCASPEYLAKAGAPQHPGELAAHRIIAVTGGHPMPDRWRFRAARGERIEQVKPQLSVNSVQAGLEAAARSLGIVRVLSYQLTPLEEAGTLQRLLTSHEPEPVPIHLVYPAGRHLPSRTRLFIDHAVAGLKGRFAE